MHHHAPLSLGDWLFVAANLAIAAGYASVPILVLRHLPLTWPELLLGAGLFTGCMGTHLWMAYSHRGVEPWWVAEHLIQAACTWGFIVVFARHVRRANSRRAARKAGP